MSNARTITARAAVNLDGLRAGELAQVDPTEPRIAALLKAELLVDEEPLYAEPPQAAEKPSPDEHAPDDPAPAPEAPKRRARSTASLDSTET